MDLPSTRCAPLVAFIVPIIRNRSEARTLESATLGMWTPTGTLLHRNSSKSRNTDYRSFSAHRTAHRTEMRPGDRRLPEREWRETRHVHKRGLEGEMRSFDGGVCHRKEGAREVDGCKSQVGDEHGADRDRCRDCGDVWDRDRYDCARGKRHGEES